MTIPEFQRHKHDKKKLIVVTAYDALFTRIVEQAGIEAILVGDSLGVVVQGKANTLSVTMDDMLYHTKLVAGAAQRALVIGDMPFMSYQASQRRRASQCGTVSAGWGSGHQAGRRRGCSRSCSCDDQYRHSGDGASRHDSPICPSIWRLQSAGERIRSCAGFAE